MERRKTTSQVSIDRKQKIFKCRNNSTSINIQNEIDNLIKHEILQSIVAYDPKLDFSCVPIVIDEHIDKHICRQTYGLIWNSIRSSNISKLVFYDQLHAFVEILQIPIEWSRYDIDLLLYNHRHKKFLNGLALRDEIVHVLQRIFKQSLNPNKSLYELKDLDFTRHTIQLKFRNLQETDLQLILSFVLLIEFDISCTTFFPDACTSLSHHEEFNEYFQDHSDIKCTHVTPSNSIKFQFDFALIEARLCDYLLKNSKVFSIILTDLFKLRRQSLKYVHRAAKYVIEITQKQTCPLNSQLSKTSESIQYSAILSREIEDATEVLFSIPLLRLVFLTICFNYKELKLTIADALQTLLNAFENNYFEHPLLKTRNVLPNIFLTYDTNIKSGLIKLIIDMQRDLKRNLHQ
ncbi:hypothetical protein I4U23_007861 [Adineta vaga]|nr:hypothetical protein I4U23_007861 [Adineta vaga]